MGAQRKYGDDIRDAIHQLVNNDGLSIPKTRTALLERFNRPVPEPTIGRIAHELHRAHNPTPTAELTDTTVPELKRGLLALIETEIARLQARNGPLDADQALKLARTLSELHGLPTSKGTADTEKPAGLLTSLHTPPNPNTTTTNPASTPVSPVPARAA